MMLLQKGNTGGRDDLEENSRLDERSWLCGEDGF